MKKVANTRFQRPQRSLHKKTVTALRGSHPQHLPDGRGTAPLTPMVFAPALADQRLLVLQRQTLAANVAYQHGNQHFIKATGRETALTFPGAIGSATSIQRQSSADAGTLAQAIARGIRHEVRLTDLLFFERHPERNRQLIDPPREPALVQEWLAIRNEEVRPALAHPESAQVAAGAAQSPAAVLSAERPAASITGVPLTTLEAAESSPQTPATASGNRLRDLEQIMQTLRELQHIAEEPPAQATQQAQMLWQQRVWQRLDDTSALGRYREPGIAASQRMTLLLREARSLVDGLTAADLQVDAQTLARFKGEYHRKLNAFTPYYTQMANQNLLWFTGDRHYDAWMRTCNLTSLAMTLQAAGIQPADFIGDQEQLLQIAQRYESRFQSFAALAELRMPDFLQLAMIYLHYPQARGADIEQRVDTARRLAAPLISSTLDVFVQVAALFGIVRAHVGYIQSSGQHAYDQDGGAVAVDAYRHAVVRQLTPWLDVGGQVVVNQPGHYVRLENIEDQGLVLDDPATKGKNYRVNWADANQIGYFRSYQVFMKK